MGGNDDQVFGIQHSEDSLFDMCFKVAVLLQVFYLTGSASKSPYGMSLEGFVQAVIDGDFHGG